MFLRPEVVAIAMCNSMQKGWVEKFMMTQFPIRAAAVVEFADFQCNNNMLKSPLPRKSSL